MFDIYIRKSELLKSEIIKNIKSKLFNKKKILEESLNKIICPSGNIEVRYKSNKFFYNRKVNGLFPDFEKYNFILFNLNKKNNEKEIVEFLNNEFKEFSNIELLNENTFKKVFFKEKDNFIDNGRILNKHKIIENFIIKKDGKLIVINNQGQEIENNEGFLIPIIKILGTDDKKKEIEEIIKIFEKNGVEIAFNDANKRFKEKYEELINLYKDIEKYKFSENNSDYNKIEILKSFEENKLELPLNFIENY